MCVRGTMLANLMRRTGALAAPYMKPRSVFLKDRKSESAPDNFVPSYFDSSNFGSCNFDLYNYTIGYWMRNNAEEQQARHIMFDFPKLCEKAIKSSPGAQKIIQCNKMEGAFNRAFIMHLDNNSKVVARIPFSVAGPARLTTNSEVATISYHWSDDPNNTVGTEYIIMDHVPGIQLTSVWVNMTPEHTLRCAGNLTKLVEQMNNIEFPAYGSIYFRNGPINSSIPLTDEFCIGPTCETEYWPCSPGKQRFYTRRPPNRGPWISFDQYKQALLDAGLSHIPAETPSQHPSSYYGTVEDHLDLLDKAGRTLEVLAQDSRIQDLCAPTLLHYDLNMRNIFVDPEDPAQITALIDWQSTSLKPLFSYAHQLPDVCDPNYDYAVEHYTGTSAKYKKLLEEVKILGYRLWVAALYGRQREPNAARSLSESLLVPFNFCHLSWEHGIAVLRQELIAVGKKWTELQLPGTPPYQPSAQELAIHAEQWEDYKITFELREQLKRELDIDVNGWVHTDNYEAAQEAMKMAWETWLQHCRNKTWNDDKAKFLWPYNFYRYTSGMVTGRIHPSLSLAYLCNDRGFKVFWTLNISEHLNIGWKSKITTIYEDKVFLWNHLRNSKTPIVPREILEGAIDTLNLLFLLNNRLMTTLLAQNGKECQGLGYCSRPRDLCLDLGKFNIWKDHIAELVEVMNEEPIGLKQPTLEKDGRNFLPFITFWVVIYVGVIIDPEPPFPNHLDAVHHQAVRPCFGAGSDYLYSSSIKAGGKGISLSPAGRLKCDAVPGSALHICYILLAAEY
ncbi:hypothetical protein O1611_g6615 [Lasiodiplodia mahajangana]|uniref:Uncharacterized protein n=1 Tax=Lasiodiplodia mahajangana TaxID=1108764 RepID=A0ACC2JI12_9PEZI|nr:hypothetical protein O1611_g6615 [Lasiodiplodia mahajangana]